MFAKVVGGVFVVSVVTLLLISRRGEVDLEAPWQFPILSQKSGKTNDLERWVAMNGDSPDDFERWMKPTNTVVEIATIDKVDAHLFEGEQMHRNRGPIRRGCVHTKISIVLWSSSMRPSLGDYV
jgi:hypothetical protein